MGWSGYNPWDGDSPNDMMSDADTYLSAGLIRLLGWSVTGRRRSRVLNKLGDEYVSQCWLSSSCSSKCRKKNPRAGNRWADPLDEWTIVGVIAMAMNRYVDVDRRVVQWAATACRDLLKNEEWIKTWRSPEERRKSLLFFAKQFEKEVARVTKTVKRGKLIFVLRRPPGPPIKEWKESRASLSARWPNRRRRKS